RAAGWAAEAGAARVVGAPNRLDAEIADVALGGEGWRISAAALRTRALVWRSDYVALSLPLGMAIETPGGRAALAGAPLQASLSFQGGALDRLALDAGAATLRLGGAAEPAVRAARAQIYLRRPPTVSSPPGLYEWLVRARYVGGGRIAEASGFDAALIGAARFAAAPGRDPAALGRLDTLRIAADSRISVEGAEARVTGDVRRAGSGRLEGRLAFETDAAPRLLDALSAAGALDAAAAARVRARVAASGRLAGVVAFRADPGGALQITLRDVGPEPIPLTPRRAR
ncbi:MAG: DUF2125 domain-containing protein, partial [Pseudomonadota bacterium]